VPRRNVAGVSWAAMRPLTVSYAQFAENHLVHKAAQIRSCHVEEFMCNRSASKACVRRNIRASRTSKVRDSMRSRSITGMGWLSVSPKAPNLLRKPPHACSLFLPTPVGRNGPQAQLFELIRLPYGFGSSLLFAISYGIWRPGHSTLPLLYKLKEIFYGVIGLHGL